MVCAVGGKQRNYLLEAVGIGGLCMLLVTYEKLLESASLSKVDPVRGASTGKW